MNLRQYSYSQSSIRATSGTPKLLKLHNDKSPCSKDRFSCSRKSPLHCTSSDNLFRNIYDENELPRTIKKTPPKSPSHLKPSVVSQIFEAPHVSNDFSCQLTDYNSNGKLAVAIESSVYFMSTSELDEEIGLSEIQCSKDLSAVSWCDDSVLISGNGHVELWDVHTLQPIQTFENHDGKVTAISCFDKRIATGGTDGYVKIYDTRCPTKKTSGKLHSSVTGLKWSPDGLTLATAGQDGIVTLSGNHFLKKKKIIHDGPVHGLTWADGNILYTGEYSHKGTLRRINVKSNEEISLLDSMLPVIDLGWNQEFGLIVGHNDITGTWDLYSHDLRKIMETKEHEGGIISLSAASNLNSFVTLSTDESLRIWQLSPLKTPTNSPYHSFDNSTSPGLGYFNHQHSPFGSSIFTLR